MSNVRTNKENAKNDEASSEAFYQNIKTSSIKDDQESATTVKVTKKDIETEENVAEKVEGLPFLKATSTAQTLPKKRKTASMIIAISISEEEAVEAETRTTAIMALQLALMKRMITCHLRKIQLKI